MGYFEPADITIYIQGRGIVLKDKSLIAYDSLTKKIIAYGKDVEQIEDTTGNIKVVSPLRRGIIADYVAAVKLFAYFLHKAWGKKPLCKPLIGICIPKGATELEKKAVEDLLYQTRAKEVLISDMPLEQLLKETALLPGNWKNVKTFISIEKDEPERYVAEELSYLLQYAGQEGITMERVAVMLRDMGAFNV